MLLRQRRSNPNCQSWARDRWLLKQVATLLPVRCVHAVFTVPEQLGRVNTMDAIIGVNGDHGCAVREGQR